MNFQTPQRELRELVCPNAPIRRVITLFKIKTVNPIPDIESIYKIINESSNEIIGVKPIIDLTMNNTKYFSVMTKMNIYDFREWIRDINYELILDNIEFELVI